MALALFLSLFIGAALGLLGGGGSTLAVPIFTYALHMEPKVAIASSLLVVAVTSAAAIIPHARAGLVSVPMAAGFGVPAMFGAFAGGRLAAHVPGEVLLAGFALIMIATGLRMLRRKTARTRDLVTGKDTDSLSPPPRVKITFLQLRRMALYGIFVGGVTGLVGAGGGFMIVPALVLFGGMSMQNAIATSLVVITMNSFAGFAGYIGHIHIDLATVGPVASIAVIGSVVGGIVGCRLPQKALRAGFGWFIIGTALYVLARQLPVELRHAAIYRAIFVDRWPWWFGGFAIAAVVVGLLLVENKQLGVSTGCAELCNLRRDPSLRTSWRLRFLLGIVLGGALAAAFSGIGPTFAMGSLDALVRGSAVMKIFVLFTGGILIGLGSRLAGGCTSGHGIVGTAQGARSSWIATALFMVAGFATTNFLFVVAGG